jgi:esterase/lipase superfamily enzyme
MWSRKRLAVTAGIVAVVVAVLMTWTLSLRRPDGQSTLPSTGGPGDQPPDDRTTQVTVFYATDRTRSQDASIQYASARNEAETLALGQITIGVPRDHRLGDVERPGVWTLYREDPDQHFVMLDSRELTYDGFYERLRTRVTESMGKEAFVFVHGFNVQFMDAVYRTAQMAYDLKFDGAPILYSWPSAASLTPIGYATDSGNSEWTVAHLRWFLADVAARSGAQRIHLIAHSMGNKALVNALNRMPRAGVKTFSHVMLTAPDMDAATFVQLTDAIKGHAETTTLYASENDAALLASKKLQTYRRAGDTSGGVVVVDGIDTVDVSAVDTNFIGHFYYGENRSVLSDMFLVLTQNLPPSQRPSLRPSGQPPNRFWRFVP